MYINEDPFLRQQMTDVLSSGRVELLSHEIGDMMPELLKRYFITWIVSHQSDRARIRENSALAELTQTTARVTT